MKRAGILGAALSIAAAAAIAMPAPASAHANACAGTGTASLSAGLYYVPTYQFNVSFSITLVGACAQGNTTVSADGTLTQASCGNSIGFGTADDGGSHSFTIATAGGVVATAGGVNGAFLAIPQGSCLNDGTNPGVSSFLIVGGAALV